MSLGSGGSVRRGIACGAALTLFAAIGVSASGTVSAQESDVRHTASFPVPSSLPRPLDPTSSPSQRWTLETATTMRPRVSGKVSANGTLCVWIGLAVDEAAFNQGAAGEFIGGAKAFSIDCGRSWSRGRPLAFRAFVAVSDAAREGLGASGEFRLSWAEAPDPSGRPTVTLGELAWVLEASTPGGWRRVAHVGAEGASAGSGWVDDPEHPSRPALVLVDDGTVPSGGAAAAPSADAAVTPIARTRRAPRAATLAERDLEFSLDEHGEPAGLYLAGASDLVPPVIEWRGDEGIGRLRLQVVAALSEPAEGRYCVRAVYDEAGVAVRLGRGPDGRFSTASSAPDGEPLACEAGAELLFPIHVAGAAFARRPGRFLINAPPGRGGTTFALADARVALRSGSVALASNTAGAAAPDGGWFVDAAGRAALLLRGDAVGSATGLRHVVLPAGAGARVLVDGVPWPDDTRIDVPSGPLTLGWDALTPPSRVLLCSDERCEQPFASLAVAASGVAVDPRAIVTDTARPTVTLGVDWRADGDAPDASRPAIAAPLAVSGAASGAVASAAPPAGAAGGELVFAPRVSWGGYSRPLTSCLGRLVGASAGSEPFALRRGLQVLDVATLPPALAGDAPVRVSFDRGRDGADCAVPGLQSAVSTLDELRARAAGGEIALDVPLASPLFVGYMQLNNRLYASSLARWKNTLEFFERLYVQGHERGRWTDGVLFGAGERSGVVPRLEPAANFVASLGDSTLMREIARAQRDNRRVASQFFGDQVGALGELFGPQPIDLVYYDDLAPDCEGYADELAASPLASRRVVVVAGIDGYTANDGALRSLPGRLAHVCVESEGLLVYAFNWRERADNEDFMQMLTTVLEDLERGEERTQ